jgi:hypothetical protein
MPRRADLTRGAFLRLGATGAAAAAGASAAGGLAASVLAPAAAQAAPPPVTPKGDDVGFLAFGAVGERASLDFYRQALKTPGIFSGADRRHLRQAALAKRQHLMKINAALGADAVSSGDFEVDLPKSSFTSRDRAVALGAGLEELLVGVYVSGAGYAADQGTRLFIARLLTVNGQLLSTLRTMAGKSPVAGLPAPMDTEVAGDVLDKLLTVPGSPGGG